MPTPGRTVQRLLHHSAQETVDMHGWLGVQGPCQWAYIETTLHSYLATQRQLPFLGVILVLLTTTPVLHVASQQPGTQVLRVAA